MLCPRRPVTRTEMERGGQVTLSRVTTFGPCLGSVCSAWRPHKPLVDTRVGYCGLAGYGPDFPDPKAST